MTSWAGLADVLSKSNEKKKEDVLASPTSLGVSVHPTPTRGPDDTLLLGSSIPKRCYFLSQGREKSRRQRSRTDAADLTANQSAARLTSRQSASRKEDEGLHARPSKVGGSCGRICQATPAKCLHRGSAEPRKGRSIDTRGDREDASKLALTCHVEPSVFALILRSVWLFQGHMSSIHVKYLHPRIYTAT